MCDRLNFETVEEFFSHYTQNPVPEWLRPFSIKTEEDLNEKYPVIGNDEFKFNLVKEYDPDNWKICFPQAIPVPYIPDRISCVEVGEKFWAISSKFSGCTMAAFRLKDNPQSRYVCHISRGYGQGKDELYKYFTKSKSIERLCMFEPYDISDKKYGKAVTGGFGVTFNDIYGLITGSNECYTFVIGRIDKKDRIVAWGKWGFNSENKWDIIQGFSEKKEEKKEERKEERKDEEEEKKAGCVIL